MEESTLMSEGLTLMLTGMGFVFVFLTVLVLVTTLMSWIITRYEKSVGALPAEGIPAPTAVLGRNQSAKSNQQSHSSQDSTLLTVLSSAIHKYRKNK
ncbi:OadG family protein [Methylophaga nitratireducenticrescens]|uniref:Probable oxaloacetate decarboxylase gamma chain n=1 Tax=Methylophaga nitratireducenticrescens TaxID=754476 RepID=I1XKM5_METNJ|nr:OadG family transporter subunit [Methylophaga nitratireducenticrescens]AFI84944.1 sodium pump decarboxylase subunit gamma [Methylophaga nitratireducenticrescens]AUZ84957.1 sodium pump decarboxylase subunit gamma [Methylophaga nitratireducenticrescens]